MRSLKFKKKKISEIICSSIVSKMIRRRRGKKGRILQLTTTRDDTFYRVVRHNCLRENVQFLLEQLQGTKGSKVAAAITGSLLLSLSLPFSLSFSFSLIQSPQLLFLQLNNCRLYSYFVLLRVFFDKASITHNFSTRTRTRR